MHSSSHAEYAELRRNAHAWLVLTIRMGSGSEVIRLCVFCEVCVRQKLLARKFDLFVCVRQENHLQENYSVCYRITVTTTL